MPKPALVLIDVQQGFDELSGIKTPSGEPLEFILAVPGRRYGEFTSLLEPMHRTHFSDAMEETLAETSWDGLRLVPKSALSHSSYIVYYVSDSRQVAQ